MSNTLSFIAVRCAYIRAGSSDLLCAVPLTNESEQELSDEELEQRAERRVADVSSDLSAQYAVVDSRIRIGTVCIKNQAFNF